MKRTAASKTTTMSVPIPHEVYRRLHHLRLARCTAGGKLPALRALVAEALEAFVAK